MTPDEWDALSWDMQRTYLEGLLGDPDVPLSVGDEQPQQGSLAGHGPDLPARQVTAAGADVIDIRAMITDLENNPVARQQV